jgi:hypothetical protein
MTGQLCQEGIPRAAALITSLLMFTPGAWSLDELATELKLSKASVSLCTRMVEQWGLIERVFLPGERRVHFRIAPDALERALSKELDSYRSLGNLLGDAAAAISADQPAVKRRLTEFADFYAFLVEHLPELAAHWRGEQETVFTDVKEG